MSNHDRHLTCYFGILNYRGLMGVKDGDVDKETGYITSSDVILPLFSHETYKIKTTFNRNYVYKGINESVHQNGSHFAKILVSEKSNKVIHQYHNKYYQKFFRKDVVWDFGDGTKKEGYSVEHSYKKPGRYKITCYFFDIDRKSWINDYSINVIVKEVLPTVIKFDKNYTKNQIKCSKIERVARLEALNSNTTGKDLDIEVKRIFTKEQHNNNFVEINNHYDDVKNDRFGFMKKHWLLLENQQTLFYNSNEVHSQYFNPSNVFVPKYNEIYGKFFYNEYEDKMDISLYQVIPYKNIDENLKTISILDPNTSILDSNSENYITVDIQQVYTLNQLPSDVISIGKRGWVDIFYKNDFIGKNNTLSFYYDIEKENITGELKSAPNYLNINPLGITFDVIENNIDDVRIGYSLDGFLRPLEGDDITSGEFYIDQHLYNTLFIGMDLDTYIFPYISEGDNEYYVPKDISLDITPYVNTIHDGKNYSYINQEDYIEIIHEWFYRIPLIIRQYINLKFDVNVGDRKIMMNLVKTKIPSPKRTVVPREIQKEENVSRLLDVYMAHPMWKGKNNIRDMFEAILSNGNYLNRILTNSENFLDDTANVKRCFLSNLISILQMMGEDVTLYESGSFEGINDLRDFVRLLSMNHTELIGHKVGDELDIKIKNDSRGKNVGEQIGISDLIHLNNNGKIDSVNELLVTLNEGVDLIIHDKYTHDTKVVSFNSIYQQINYPKDGQALVFRNPVKIEDYEEWWGWNLLLPDSFNSINNKIIEYEKKLNNRAISQSSREILKSEITRLKKIKGDLINGYYSFHLLIPTTDLVRKGNFMNDTFVTTRIESTDEWESLWGITHEVLMKILIEHGFLQNDRGDDYDTELGDISAINIVKKFDDKQIETTIKVNGTSAEYDVSGSVTVAGDILDKSGNLLRISLDKGIINDRDVFSMVDGVIECFVDDQGNILPVTQEGVFNLTGNRINGKLHVILSGNVKSPTCEMWAEINYNPAVTKSIVNKIIKISSPVYIDEIQQKTINFIGDVCLTGEILGVGDNTLTVEFNNGTITYDGVIETNEEGNRYDNIVLEYPENDIRIVVASDGTIYQKIETFKVINDPDNNLYKNGDDSVLPDGMLYDYRTGWGEIRMVIGGSVDDISIKVDSELFIKSPDFIQLPDEVIISDNKYNFELEPFRMYSNYERRNGTTYKEIGHRVSDVKLTLINPRYDYNKGCCYMDGTMSFGYSVPTEYNNGYYTNKTYLIDYHTSDIDKSRYGKWQTETREFAFNEEFEFDTVVGDMVRPVIKTFEFDGEKITGGLKVKIDGCIDDKIGAGGEPIRDIRITIDEVNDDPLKGVFVSLFDIDENYTLSVEEKSEWKDNWNCYSISVKNKGNYPTYFKADTYNLKPNVSIDVVFYNEYNNKICSTTATYAGALSGIEVGQDGSLTHGDMVFDIKECQLTNATVSGTITIGVVDSQYIVKNVALKYTLKSWTLSVQSADVESYQGNYCSASTSGIITPSKTQVLEDEYFDLAMSVTLKSYSWNGTADWDYASKSNNNVIKNVYIDSLSGKVVMPTSLPHDVEARVYMDNYYQNVTAKAVVTCTSYVQNASTRTITFIQKNTTPNVDVKFYSHDMASKIFYWSLPAAYYDSEYPSTFYSSIAKEYINTSKPMSICGDYPHFTASDSLISYSPHYLEIGGFYTDGPSNVIFQNLPSYHYLSVLPINTIFDAQLIKDNNENNIFEDGDVCEYAYMPINLNTISEKIRVYVSNSYCYIAEDDRDLIFSGSCEKEFKFEDSNSELNSETYKYEMTGYFKLPSQYYIFDDIPISLDTTVQEPLKFTKELLQTPEIYVVYDNNTSQVTKVQLSNLINGESMFYGHQLSTDSIPDATGGYNRISDEVTFDNGLSKLKTTDDMFETCVLTGTQLLGILSSLKFNENGGSITIGIDWLAKNNDVLKKITELYDGSFTSWDKKEITLNTSAGNTWKITLKYNT